jgi:hypothetical protein
MFNLTTSIVFILVLVGYLRTTLNDTDNNYTANFYSRTRVKYTKSHGFLYMIFP